MPLSAVFFDLDGTLVDSNERHVAAWAKSFAEAGHIIPLERIRRQIGKGGDNLVPALLPGADEPFQKRLSERQGAIFTTEHITHVRAFPGAHALLARLCEAGTQVLFASSAPDKDVEHYLELLDARDLVAATTSADDVENSKPAGDIFAAALTKVEPIGPRDVLVVGDTPYDVEAAARCGIATIAVRSGGFADAALIEAGALRLYDDVAAILADFDNSPLAET
jgi:HAD superfamily hydrolase (TIGR01509 family)